MYERQEDIMWYVEYKSQLIISGIAGGLFALYRVICGATIGAAIEYGAGTAVLVFIGLLLLTGIFGTTEKETATTLDKFIEEKESAERNTVQKSTLPKDATRLQETFEIPGAFYHRTSIAKVANPNPDWRKSCKSLIKAGKANQKIYRFERTTKTAELVEEPNNPHDKNAVMVIVDGEKIGYIGADENLHVKSILKSKTVKSISATITGGEYKTIISESDMIKDKTGPYVTVKIQYQ